MSYNYLPKLKLYLHVFISNSGKHKTTLRWQLVLNLSIFSTKIM